MTNRAVNVFNREVRKATQSTNLSVKETAELVAKAKRGDQSARETLIIHLIPVGLSFIKKYRRENGLQSEDIISIANEAIVENIDRAIASYDPSKGGDISGYMLRVINMKLAEASAQLGKVIDLPTDHRFIKAKTGKESPRRTQLRADLVSQMFEVSLADPVQNEKEEEVLNYEEVLPSSSPTPEEIVSRDEGREVIRKIITQIIGESDAEVMFLLFGLNPDASHPMSESEVIAHTGIGEMQLKHLKTKAYKALRSVQGFEELLKLLLQPHRYAGKANLEAVNIIDPSSARTSRSPQTKLTDDQVRELRNLRAAGVPNHVLAKKFGISESTASEIANGRKYKQVK